jgi:RHS repeat-associated protein
VTKADGSVIQYAYDFDGNRVQTKTTLAGQATQTVNYLVDTDGGLSHVIADSDGSGQLTALYAYANDTLVGIVRPTGPSTWATQWVHSDYLGSIRALTDDNKNVTDTYTYDAFGQLLKHTGTDPQPFAFAGEPLDPNVGFQYHRARWMDPRVGRFTGMDPFGGDPNDPLTLHKYAYAMDSPVDLQDPSGMFGDFGGGGALSLVSALIEVPSSLARVLIEGSPSGGSGGSGSGRDPFLTPLLPLPQDLEHRQLAGVAFAETLRRNFEDKVAIETVFAYRAFEAGLCPRANGGPKDIGFGDGTVAGAITTGSRAVGDERWNLIFQGMDLAPYETIKATLVQNSLVQQMNEATLAAEDVPGSAGPFVGLSELNGRVPIAFNRAGRPESFRWEFIGHIDHDFYGFIPGRDCR